MGGWTGEGKDTIIWDGTIKAKAFNGNSVNFVFFDDVNKRIGISTSTPLNTLHILKDENSDTVFRIENTNTGTAAKASFYASTGPGIATVRMETYSSGFSEATYAGNSMIMTAGVTNKLFFGTIGVRRMTLDIDGHILIGSGTAPATSGVLDIVSTTGALLIPRLTTVQRDALTAVNGMLIYNSTLNKFQGYENGAWANLI